MEQVILVNEHDAVLGFADKLEAHEKGLLHRAISLLHFNSAGELLLQKRADGKYHSAGLWTNTCCSHPRVDENTKDAVVRRAKEEMGILVNPTHAFTFTYKTEFGNGLTEHEVDHVFISTSDVVPQADPSEVSEWKYVSVDKLRVDIQNNPDGYTYWFRLILNNPQLSSFIPVPVN